MRHCNNPGGLEVERLFLCHTTKLYKPAAFLYHAELSITVTHFSAAGRFKTHNKAIPVGYFKEQVRVASERGEVVACSIPGEPVRYPQRKLPKALDVVTKTSSFKRECKR